MSHFSVWTWGRAIWTGEINLDPLDQTHFILGLCCDIDQKEDEASTPCWQGRQTVWMHSVEGGDSDWRVLLLGSFNPLALSLTCPGKQTVLFRKVSKDSLSQHTLSPCLTILHSQKVLIHNRNVYCAERTTFPSVPFSPAMENSWGGFDISVMNLKAALKTLFKCSFPRRNKPDSFSICHRERWFSIHLALLRRELQ